MWLRWFIDFTLPWCLWVCSTVWVGFNKLSSRLSCSTLHLLICSSMGSGLWVSGFSDCCCLFRSLNVWVLIAMSHSVEGLWNWGSSQYPISVPRGLPGSNADGGPHEGCHRHVIATKLRLMHCCHSEDWQWVLLHFLIEPQELFPWVLPFFSISHSRGWRFLWGVCCC